MTDTQIILLTIGIVIAIAIIIIFLSGLFIVKKDEVCVFEKFYKYHTFKTKGIYFFTPFITKRVGKYKLDNMYLKINLEHDKIYLVYKIKDAKLYHYNPNFKDEIYNKLLAKKQEKNILVEEILKTTSLFGIEIVSLKINEELIK